MLVSRVRMDEKMILEAAEKRGVTLDLIDAVSYTHLTLPTTERV